MVTVTDLGNYRVRVSGAMQHDSVDVSADGTVTAGAQSVAPDFDVDITPLEGESASSAAMRWARDAYGITLVPAPLTTEQIVAKQLGIVAADPSLAQSTKDALAAAIAALTK